MNYIFLISRCVYLDAMGCHVFACPFQAVIQIQSILRGHSVRKRRIGDLSESHDEEVDGRELEWEDAVTRIQSALRAHHSRRKYLPNSDSSKNGKIHR